MLFKKCEPKKKHGTLTLAVTALSVVGAITVVHFTKSTLCRMKTKMCNMWRNMTGGGTTCPQCPTAEDEDEQY